jgi:hypothetical protein
MAVDFKSLSKNDQGALISGALAVIFTFLGSYMTVSFKVASVSSSSGHNAWDGWGVLGSLLLIAALAIVAVRIFAADSLPDGVPWNLTALAAAALGTLILLIKGLTYSAGGIAGAGVDAGPGWSAWVLFILSIVFTGFLFLLFKESGEKLPEIKKDTPPAA